MPSWGGELLPWSLQLLVYPSQEIRTLPRPTLHRSRRHHLRTSLDRTVRPGKLRSSRGRGRRSHVPRFALDRRGVALRVEVESVGVGTGKGLRLRWGRGHDVGCCVSEHSCLIGFNSSKIAFNWRVHSRVLVELLLVLAWDAFLSRSALATRAASGWTEEAAASCVPIWWRGAWSATATIVAASARRTLSFRMGSAGTMGEGPTWSPLPWGRQGEWSSWWPWVRVWVFRTGVAEAGKEEGR